MFHLFDVLTNGGIVYKYVHYSAKKCTQVCKCVHVAWERERKSKWEWDGEKEREVCESLSVKEQIKLESKWHKLRECE